MVPADGSVFSGLDSSDELMEIHSTDESARIDSSSDEQMRMNSECESPVYDAAVRLSVLCPKVKTATHYMWVRRYTLHVLFLYHV